MQPIRLTLYVAGDTVRSQRAVANLERLVDLALPAECSFTVVDVMVDPDAADAARILTTPTLVRESPDPQRRVTGDLSDAETVLSGLSLDVDLSSLARSEQE